jgi:hypothetical protein
MWEFNPQDQSAVRIVAQMDELFAIDAQARQERLSQEDRQFLRLEKFKPLARSSWQKSSRSACQKILPLSATKAMIAPPSDRQ